jgi:rhamnulokinase
VSVHRYIACDLGAESGRVMLGNLDDDRLTLEEIHRFQNGPVEVSGSLRWDVAHIFHELKAGLRKVAERSIPISSLSCDSWGVDYVLLDENGHVLTEPFHYRDKRTDGALARASATVSAQEVFAETGIQSMSINTLYQLLVDLEQRPSVLDSASRFLNIGDFFNYLFSGVAKAEESLVSTTQVYDPRHRRWSSRLIEEFGLPSHIFPSVVPSGTILGRLLDSVAAETGLHDAQVVASCSHDTEAAVAAVPAEGYEWAYLSSGTWSLLGVENPEPIINEEARESDFSNELGHGGSICFLKNIPGLWVIQECRRAWARDGKEYSYDQLTQMAAVATPMLSFIDPMDASFATPDDMPSEVASYCRTSNQRVPLTPGEIVRCVLESLALCYRRTFHQLEQVTGRRLATLHVVGGGSKNQLLNQLTADSTGRTVLAGPVECSAIGNVLIQAIALGHIQSLAAAREIVRRSFPLVPYEPEDEMLWEEAGNRFELNDSAKDNPHE